MIDSRSLWPWRTSATSFSRTGMPLAGELPPPAPCSELAAAIAAAEPVDAATASICCCAALLPPPSPLRVVISISRISSMLAN